MALKYHSMVSPYVFLHEHFLEIYCVETNENYPISFLAINKKAFQ